MATTARGIVYPVVGTTLTPLANHFAALATSTNTAIDNAVANGGAFRGLTSAMGAAGQEGRTYYATDTNRSWFDDGTNWISNDGGMYLIRPTSVTGGTILANGHVTPNAATTAVSLNGVFSSRFRTYEIVFQLYTTGSAGRYFRFRNAGADNSTANYFQRGIWQNNTTLSTNDGNSLSYVSVLAPDSTRGYGRIKVFNPQTAGAIKFMQGEVNAITPNSFHTFMGYLSNYDASTYDGFTMSIQSGTYDVANPTANDIAIYGIA